MIDEEEIIAAVQEALEEEEEEEGEEESRTIQYQIWMLWIAFKIYSIIYNIILI